MRILLILPLLLTLTLPLQDTASEEGSSVTVLGFKWSKTRLTTEKAAEASTATAPAREMIPQNKNLQRNVRVNDPVGVRDPNLDTIDGRRAAMDQAVEESRTSRPKTVDGFAYHANVQNASSKVIEIMFWEYQFADAASPTNVVRRQFLCGVNIKPGKQKELKAFSVSGPGDVVSVENLKNKSNNALRENVVINRVEYADGSIWQRKDWNFGEIRLTYKRAIATPWGSEMCRAL